MEKRGEEVKILKRGAKLDQGVGVLKKGACNRLTNYAKGNFTCGGTWVIKFGQ